MRIWFFNTTGKGVIAVKQRSQAELHEGTSIVVTLAGHDWTCKNTCELAVMFGKKRILTDCGYARLDMSRMPINFGSTNGHVDNGDHLTKVMCAAASDYLRSSAFTLRVIEHHKEVRFALSPLQPVKHLMLSKYFETSLATFCGVDPLFQQMLDPQQKQAVAA